MNPRRGFWQLTADGESLVASNPTDLSGKVQELSAELLRVPLAPGAIPDRIEAQPSTVSPDDRLNQALFEIRDSVMAELRDQLSRVSPTSFETIVLDVLHRLGYGASRDDLNRVGGTGDGGIDGVISLDRLGLEKVYVQAKRWQQNVGRPEIQAFYGAVVGQHARKGVFITTSGFTPQANEYVKSVEGIVLIDGRRLTELMVDCEVGVSARVLKIPKLDSDYFDEETA